MPREGKCGVKCFPVCYYHFCEEKGRAAEQDFSTADPRKMLINFEAILDNCLLQLFFFCVKSLAALVTLAECWKHSEFLHHWKQMM